MQLQVEVQELQQARPVADLQATAQLVDPNQALDRQSLQETQAATVVLQVLPRQLQQWKHLQELLLLQCPLLHLVQLLQHGCI